jgi:protein deglycase
MNVLVPLAEGFEEIETCTIIDILRRAQIKVTVAGLKEGAICGSHGIWIVPDVYLEKVTDDDCDAIVLPGGNPGFINLAGSQRLLDTIRAMHTEGKLVAAVCAGPSVLATAGILSGVPATIYPGMESSLGGARYSPERVVVAGNIVTGQGVGTVLEFAVKLVEILMGAAAAASIKKQVLADF